jgi:hypothetical protein
MLRYLASDASWTWVFVRCLLWKEEGWAQLFSYGCLWVAVSIKHWAGWRKVSVQLWPGVAFLAGGRALCCSVAHGLVLFSV